MAENKGFRSVAYFLNKATCDRENNPQDLPVKNLTHVLYAFADVRPETGEVYLTDSLSDVEKKYETDSSNNTGNNVYGCIKQINILKKQNRNLKLLLSIGGQICSSNFAAPASTDSGRQNFATSCVRLVKDLGLDGIDVGWHDPQDDREAFEYVSLLAVIRAKLDAYASSLEGSVYDGKPPHFELTIAVQADITPLGKLCLREMDEYLDFINLIAYDYSGSWSDLTSHQGNLFEDQKNPVSTPYNTDLAVRYCIEVGIPTPKLVIGMPLFGRSFLATDGLGKRFDGIGEGSWGKGVWDAKALPRLGATEYYNREIGASWSYCPASRELVTYDTKEVALQKAEFVRDGNLGGAMWWEYSGDKTGSGSLIRTVFDTLKGSSQGIEYKENVLLYPESKYDNLREGFPNN